MVKDFEINSIDLSTGEKSIKSFKFSPLSENLSSIAFQIYTNQKKIGLFILLQNHVQTLDLVVQNLIGKKVQVVLEWEQLALL